VYLVDTTGTNIGNNKADTTTFWPTSQTTASYGSSSDLWGTTWQPFKVNNSNFGVRLSVQNNVALVRTAYVYWIKITVYYTPQVTGWKTPAHCTSQTRSGSAIAWTNYSRAETSDNYYAEASVPTSSYTDWLRVDEFGLGDDDIPFAAMATGIDVKIERKAGITNNLYDSSLRLRVPEYTTSEYQNTYDAYGYLYNGGNTRAGQKLTISNRTVTGLRFRLAKGGSPTGNVTFTIRKVSDDSVINSKVWGDASSLVNTYGPRTVTFDTPVLINEEVRILCEFSGGDGANNVAYCYSSTDVKGSETITTYDGTYTNNSAQDMRYVYWYESETYGVDKASATKWTTTDTEVTYFWNVSGQFLGSAVHDTDFGVQLSVACDADAETIAYVDCISVRVYYAGEPALLAETLYDSHNTGDDAFTPIYNTYWRAMSFTASSSYKLTSLVLKLFKTSTVTASHAIDVELYATDVNGKPTGSALCSGTYDTDDLATGSPYTEAEISMGAGYQITEGIMYAIVVSAPTITTFPQRTYWRYDTDISDAYPGGHMMWSNNSGSSWNDSADNWDCWFEAWGQSGVTEGFLLMETGEYLLLEIGDKILLETIGGLNYVRIINLNLSIDPTVGRVVAWDRAIASNLSLATTILKGYGRVIASNLSLTTTIGRKVTWDRAVDSLLNITTTVGRAMTFTRTVASNLNLTLDIVRRAARDFFESISMTLNITPTVGRKFDAKRTIASNLSLSLSISKAMAWTRTVASNLSLTTTITRTRGITRTIAISRLPRL
jgi:hypothetical protein